MSAMFPTLADLLDHGFDSVIDVRSPSEFAEDHVPGAINLPVLNDAERAEVGTVYKQQSPFLARKIGASLVFRNAARHVDGPLRGKDGAWRPLVYCWRGGQRSGTFRWMLEQIGWRAEAIVGGYQTYRKLVHELLYQDTLPHQFLIVDGYTGTAKTEILGELATRGRQVIDLEAMAAHRGSLLGGMDDPQPAQKMFESRIAEAIARFDEDQPVLVEAESAKIGARCLPPALWNAMKSAARVEVASDLTERVSYLCSAYHDVLNDSARLQTLLTHLRPVRGHAIVDGWFGQIMADDKLGLVEALITEHYDPAYDAARRKATSIPVPRVVVPSLTAEGIARAADTIEKLIDDQGAA